MQEVRLPCPCPQAELVLLCELMQGCVQGRESGWGWGVVRADSYKDTGSPLHLHREGRFSNSLRSACEKKLSLSTLISEPRIA